MATNDGKFVCYYRVSTGRQGKSGLGLAWMPSARRLPHISTAEAGRLSTNSPRSRAANVRIGLHSTRRWRAARLHRASLVVSEVDLLTRSVAFLSRLLKAGVDARFADLPQIEGATGRSLLQHGRGGRARGRHDLGTH
jgi:hypothetical protein